MKKLSISILLILSVLLSGCSQRSGIYANYRAIELLEIIQSLGVDSEEDGGVTLSASTGKSESNNAPILLCRHADNLPQAIDTLQDYAPKGELFFAHVQYIVMGRDAAERGIDSLLDFIERDNEMRMGTKFFILRSGTAEALFTASAGGDITETLASVTRDVETRGDSHAYSFREIARNLNEYGAALCGALQAVETEDSVFSEGAAISVIPGGYAILREGRLVGFLGDGEAKAASLLTRRLGITTYTVSDGASGEIVLEIDDSKVKLRPVWSADGTPGIAVEADVDAVIAQAESWQTEPMDKNHMDFLSHELAQQLTRDILAVLDLSRDLDADFLGLGGVLRRDDAAKFDALGSPFLDRVSFTVRVEARLAHNYDLTDNGKGGDAA